MGLDIWKIFFTNFTKRDVLTVSPTVVSDPVHQMDEEEGEVYGRRSHGTCAPRSDLRTLNRGVVGTLYKIEWERFVVRDVCPFV